MKKVTGKWVFVFIIALVCILVISILIMSKASNKFNASDLGNNKIAVIQIQGPITGGTAFREGLFTEDGSNSATIVGFIESANKDKGIKGIILNINSPGGTVVASKEIVDAIKKVDKPVVALIREVGASGAYWIASAADVIVADPLSITGSIGVFGGYLEFSGLISEYDVKYHNLKTGEYKDLGNPFVSLTPEGEKILNQKLQIIHDYFVEDVNKNRGKDLSKYGNGLFYLGKEAKEIGLVDVLGNKDDAVKIVKEKAGIKTHELIFFKKKTSLLDVLGRLSNDFGYSIGEGIGSEFGIKEDFKIVA